MIVLVQITGNINTE